MKVYTIVVGNRQIQVAETHDGKMLIRIAGHDAQGMYGSEGIILDASKSTDFFEALCDVMPGAVQ